MSDDEKGLDELEHGHVQDKAAYKKWIALMNLSIIKDTIHFASDDRKINFAWLQNHFEKMIEGLPNEERVELLVHKKKYYSSLSRANIQKRNAFGIIAGKRTPGGRMVGLLDVKEHDIVELFGRMFSTKEVHKIIVRDWKIPCTIDLVFDYRRKHVNTISELIEKHKREYSDIRLGVKRSRLEELVYLYNELKDKFKVGKSREDVRVMLTLIEQVRKEVEGDSIRIDGNLDINVESTVNIHLQQEVFKEISLAQIILGRVASRAGIDGVMLIKSLQDSYYSRFNKILGIDDTEDVEYEELVYPSASAYDFDNISKVNKQTELNNIIEKKAKKEKREGDMDEAAKLGLKEVLLAKIRQKIADNKASSMKVEEELLKKEVEDYGKLKIKKT